MNEWRKEIREILDTLDCRRPPVLRRSLKEDQIYTTDLPQAANEETVRQFIRTSGNAGWRTETGNEWIHLDRDIRLPPEGYGPAKYGQEAENCLSILRRQSDKILSDGRIERMLIKAAEEGTISFEATCKKLHAEWAIMLRSQHCVPDIDETYFGGGNGTC